VSQDSSKEESLEDEIVMTESPVMIIEDLQKEVTEEAETIELDLL